jgi:protein-tyrosine phosphatase
MAEALCRKLLADRLGCTPAELGDRGVMVMSAGLQAQMGGRPSEEAVVVMRERGINLADHVSQPLSPQHVQHADLILTMTRTHRAMIVAEWPEAAARTAVLSRGQDDIVDPIGGPVEFYQQCADQIQAEVAARLEDLKL